MDRIFIEIPGVPVGKGRPRVVFTGPRSGTLYTPKETRDYEKRIAEAGKAAMNGKPLYGGAVRMRVDVFVPPRKSWSKKMKTLALAGELRPFRGKHYDYDNYAKIAGDALNGVVYLDDRQIVEGKIAKFYSEQPRLEVTIERVTA